MIIIKTSLGQSIYFLQDDAITFLMKSSFKVIYNVGYDLTWKECVILLEQARKNPVKVNAVGLTGNYFTITNELPDNQTQE